MLAAEVAADVMDPEELRDVAGRCLAAVITEVEALGGTVTRAAEAVAATRRLRDHTQFPAGLEAALTAASQACDQDRPDQATTSLTAALDLARTLGYF